MLSTTNKTNTCIVCIKRHQNDMCKTIQKRKLMIVYVLFKHFLYVRNNIKHLFNQEYWNDYHCMLNKKMNQNTGT